MSSFVSVQSPNGEGITVTYRPTRVTNYGTRVSAGVSVDLIGSYARLALSIQDARTLFEALPGVLAAHDAAVRDAAEHGEPAAVTVVA